MREYHIGNIITLQFLLYIELMVVSHLVFARKPREMYGRTHPKLEHSSDPNNLYVVR